MIDLEPTVIGFFNILIKLRLKMRSGSLEKLILFGTINNNERSLYTIGKEIIDVLLDRIRRLSENCSNLQLS